MRKREWNVWVLSLACSSMLEFQRYSQKEEIWENFKSSYHPDLLGVLRTQGFYINFRQWAINGHKYCVLAHAFSPQRAEHALRRKCSWMAAPSKRDSVNAQSSFKFRSVDSQTIFFDYSFRQSAVNASLNAACFKHEKENASLPLWCCLFRKEKPYPSLIHRKTGGY